MKKTVSIVLAVLILSVALVACGGGGNNTPDATVQKFINAINSNNTNALAECFEPTYQELIKSSFALLSSMDMTLADAMGMGSEKLGLTIENVAIDGDSATVTATLIIDGQSDTDDIPLKMVDGQWYIDAGFAGLGG